MATALAAAAAAAAATLAPCTLAAASEGEASGAAPGARVNLIQLFFDDGAGGSAGLREKWAGVVQTWAHPEIERRVYDLEDGLRAVRDVMPVAVERYKSFRQPIEKADFMRYALLYRDGGVYADMDQELVDADRLIAVARSGYLVLPQEPSGRDETLKGYVAQSLLVSPPKHPFWLALMRSILRRYRPWCSPPQNTGPEAITIFFAQSGGCQRWGPEGVAVAVDLMGMQMWLPKGMIVFHYLSSSWTDNPVQRRLKSQNDSIRGVCRGQQTLIPDAGCTRMVDSLLPATAASPRAGGAGGTPAQLYYWRQLMLEYTASVANGLAVFQLRYKAPDAEAFRKQDIWNRCAATWDRAGVYRHVFNEGVGLLAVQAVMPDAVARMSSFRHPIERVDFMRYAVLYKAGGVYVDMDQELWNRSALHGLASTGLVLLPMEKSEHLNYMAQSILISPAGHRFWLGLMRYILRHYKPSCSPPENTGPLAITNFFMSSGGCARWHREGVAVGVDIMGNEAWVPKANVVFHHLTASWESDAVKARLQSRNGSAKATCGQSRNHLAVWESCIRTVNELLTQGSAAS